MFPIYLNARAIIEQGSDEERMILLEVRNKPHEGGQWLELPGGRVEEFESPVSALKREAMEETRLKEITLIEESNTRLGTGSSDANVECLTPFAVYQTINGPIDSMSVYFLCQAQGQLLSVGDDTEEIQWVSIWLITEWMKTNPEEFNWVDRAGSLFHLKHRSMLQRSENERCV